MIRISNDDFDELLYSAARMLEAINILWAAEHPEEMEDEDSPMEVEQARDLHAERETRLRRAIHTAQRRAVRDLEPF